MGQYPFKKINIQVIPHGCQRYETYGDYFVDEKDVLQIRVSEFENPDHAFRIIMHELAESWRCRRNQVDYREIDEFDLAHLDSDEPGRLPDAPYHKEHYLSEQIERLLCRQDGEKWKDYYNTPPIGASK